MNVFRDKRVLVTGATDGIGLRTATRLSSHGAHVLVHGRDPERVRAALRQVHGAEPLVADLSSLGAVRRMGEAVAQGRRLDLLINNAGIGSGSPSSGRETSADGYELRWAVNFLAPFALTEWLLAHGAAPGAIVNVASLGQAPIDFDDPQLVRRYDGFHAYMQSKLALVAWTFDLAARVPSLAITALHPGTFLATKMVSEAGIAAQGTVDSGAQAILAVARLTLAGKTRGAFFDEDREARALDQAYDPEVQGRLRRLAEDQVQRAVSA